MADLPAIAEHKRRAAAANAKQYARHLANGGSPLAPTGRFGPTDQAGTSPYIPDAAKVRHLIYHVYPLAFVGGEVWRWNIEQLKRRLSLFNGKRVIGIATDADTETAASVRHELRACDCEFVEVANDGQLREHTTFEQLLTRVRSDDPTHATFYAHAKGVSRRHLASVRRWTAALYETCLDWFDDVAALLQTHGTVGTFVNEGTHWYFPGAFYWFRNRDLFARNWNTYDRSAHTVEAYPALQFDRSEAGVLVCSGPFQALNLYSDEVADSIEANELAIARLLRQAGAKRPLQGSVNRVANPARTRHLLYHVYPHTANGGAAWRWNAEELRKRLPLFNGKKVIGIATDADTDDAGAVKALLPGCEFVEVANDPKLREVATFTALFERVAAHVGEGDATFYGHAKGVSPGKDNDPIVRRWTEAMYQSCLDGTDAVVKALRDHPVAGTFVKTGSPWPDASTSDWHFSGSMFWFRNKDLFGKEDWHRIDRFWSGIEAYPSLHFQRHEAAALVSSHRTEQADLYHAETWTDLQPLLAKARAAHQPPSVLNLAYHCTPLKDSAVWRENVAQVMRRATLFNGKRLVAVVQGDGCEPLATVREAFRGLHAEFIVCPRSELREASTFLALLDRMQSTNANEATFYAHTKGVRSDVTGEAGRRWRNNLYAALLDDVPRVQSLLAVNACVGSHRRRRVGLGVHDFPELPTCLFHYSGAFFWFRHSDVFTLPNWRELPPTRWGVEAWLGTLLPLERSACIAFDDFGLDKPLTTEDYGPDLPELPVPLRVELGGGLKPRPGFVNVDQCAPADVLLDLAAAPLPFADASVEAVYTSHCLEHVANLNHVLREIVRVGKVGAAVEIRVPSWLSSMALCPGHRQTISEQQVDHWTTSAVPYWFAGSPRRLHLRTTEYMPSGDFAEAKRLFPQMTDEQVLRFVPNACHEIRFGFEVIVND